MRHRIDGQHVNVCRQFGVDAPPQRLRGQRLAHVEMRDLPERVDAGIGSPRARELERLLADRGANGALDLTLDGARVLLLLPAAVFRSRVFDRQLESRHVSL